MIIPRIKKCIKQESVFKGNLIFDTTEDVSKKAVDLLTLFLPGLIFRVDKSSNVIFKKEALKKGGYKLNITTDKIFISYADDEGVRNAVATLVQLINDNKIKCCLIDDEPDNEFRSCLLDLARGYVEISVLKEHIVRMALLKFNYVHLHLMDRQSYVLESSVFPNPDKHRLYSKNEIRELLNFCKALSIEVIPEIEIPAHAVNQIKALPELSCEIDDIQGALEQIRSIDNPRKREFTDALKGISTWVVCAGKESTYQIYENLIVEICELFDGEYLHIGGDELSFEHLGAYCYWDNCICCKKRMKEEGLSNTRELYYYLVKRMYRIVKNQGKKMIMWNDQINSFDETDIPKDIVLEFWNDHASGTNKGNCQRLLNQGYKIINAHYRYTYVDFPEYMQENNINKWHTRLDFLDEKELCGNIMGGEMCAWNLGDPLFSFYPYSLPVCMTLFADRVWNDEDTDYNEEYKKAIFSIITGKFNVGINPFTYFQELIPPHDINKCMVESVDFEKINFKELNETIEQIKLIDKNKIYGKIALGAYIQCIETIECILSEKQYRGEVV
ncbi:MAG: family 20 glycosylhydrolase [Clostridia bacterium]|nr:family 20 glycosylhydrolase [Clostridia bacterium]